MFRIPHWHGGGFHRTNTERAGLADVQSFQEISEAFVLPINCKSLIPRIKKVIIRMTGRPGKGK